MDKKLVIFYNSKYDKHIGVSGSFEGADRIKYVIDNISSKIELKTEEFFSDKELDKFINYSTIIKNIKTKYDKLEFLNCINCSFKNDIKSDKCVMCYSSNNLKLMIKIVSDIDGDGTSMCKDSIKSVESSIKTICSGLDFQAKTNNNVFLLIRPPGHHSTIINKSNNGCSFTNDGFCIINNISIGIDYLKNKYNIKKIAIVDWDVHHGHGTQQIYYERSDILFIDIHRYDGKFYPGTGNINEIGSGEGKNYTINIPLDKNSDEKIYLKAFDEICIPSIQKFNPDWIFISCGFDAHKDDPIGGMKLESSSYRKFYDKIYQLNLKTNITLFLEGGYNKNSILESICKLVK